MIHLCPDFPEYLPQGVPWLDMWGPNPPPQRNIPAPLGFEPLTQGSISNPPTNCTLWRPDNHDVCVLSSGYRG